MNSNLENVIKNLANPSKNDINEYYEFAKQLFGEICYNTTNESLRSVDSVIKSMDIVNRFALRAIDTEHAIFPELNNVCMDTFTKGVFDAAAHSLQIMDYEKVKKYAVALISQVRANKNAINEAMKAKKEQVKMLKDAIYNESNENVK